MAELRHGTCLAEEPALEGLRAGGLDHLQRDLTLKLEVGRHEDRTHGPRADLPAQLVAAEAGGGGLRAEESAPQRGPHPGRLQRLAGRERGLVHEGLVAGHAVDNDLVVFRVPVVIVLPAVGTTPP
ncbi:MAG: hypothetical protein R3B72_17735 [Polyangiaceae bacterium]